MSKNSKFVPAQPKLVALVAAMALCQLSLAQVAQAQTAPAAAPATTPGAPPAAAAPLEPPAPTQGSGLGFSERVFGDSNTSNSANQSSVTPSYELGGIGRRTLSSNDERIMTAPTVGLPVRFDNGVFVYPSALIGFGRNDNLLSTSVNQVSSSLVSLQPGVVAELKNRGDRYTLLYRGNYTRYANSSEDNFNQHELAVAGDNFFDSRNRIGWTAGYVNRTDPRGSTDRAISTDPDRWNAENLRAMYVYGSKGAIGRVEVEGGYTRKRYENNRTTTVLSDVDTGALAGRFYYRVAPRTSLIGEVRLTKADYVSPDSPNDNTDSRVLVGATWEATAKTSGTLKAGYLRKNFNAAGLTATGFTWEGSVRWSPLTYSTVDLITSKSVAESTGFGSYVTNTSATALWNHKWSQTVSSRFTLGTVKSDFANANRTDTTNNLGAGVFYEMGRNLRGGAELTRTDRSSNQSIYDFRRNVLFVSVEGTL